MEASETGLTLRLPSDLKDLRQWMNSLVDDFHTLKYLETDPVQFAHRYSKPEDQEIAAFFGALFAFGNVKAIHQIVSSLLSRLGPSPSEKLKHASDRELTEITHGLYYRFYTSQDILVLLKALRRALNSKLGLKKTAARLWKGDPIELIAGLRETLMEDFRFTPGLRFMFSNSRVSPSKRWHLLLRWLVRKDHIDLGLWDFIPKNRLLLPLDVHIFQIAQHLKLTDKKSPSIAVMKSLTEKFKEWDPEDPIKYDFALCRIGVLRLKSQLIAPKKKLARVRILQIRRKAHKKG